MIWEIELECFHSLRRKFDRHAFPLFIHGSVWRSNDMEGNREIGVVIDGRITMGYLCFYSHTCLYR